MNSGIQSEAEICLEWHSEKGQTWKKISYAQSTQHFLVFLAHHINACSGIQSTYLWYLSSQEPSTRALADVISLDNCWWLSIWKSFTQQLFIHQLQHFLHHAIILIIMIKLEIIIKVIKIMIKSERIFVLKEVTVYQVDTVKSNEKTSLVIEASFYKT